MSILISTTAVVHFLAGLLKPLLLLSTSYITVVCHNHVRRVSRISLCSAAVDAAVPSTDLDNHNAENHC